MSVMGSSSIGDLIDLASQLRHAFSKREKALA